MMHLPKANHDLHPSENLLDEISLLLTDRMPGARVRLVRHTPHTITDRHALAAELDRVRAQGFAIVDQELEMGLRAFAVPIARPDGAVIAALNVGAHAARADARTLQRDVLPVLRRAAAAIGKGIGA